MQLKLTPTILAMLAEEDKEFILTISHAAAKQIAEDYSQVLVESLAVKTVLQLVDKNIAQAQIAAGDKIEQLLGDWGGYNGNYRLRQKVVDSINSQFEAILKERFEKWLESKDVAAIIEAHLRDYAERLLKKHLEKSLAAFLKEKY